MRPQGLAGPQGQGVVLAAHEVGPEEPRGLEPEPGRDRALGARLRPLGGHDLDLDPGSRDLRRHSLQPCLGRRGLGRTLHVEDRAPSRQQRPELARLDPPDLLVVGGHGRDDEPGVHGPERFEVTGGPIQQDPADPGLDRVARHPLEPVGHPRLDDQGERPLFRRRVDDPEELLDLEDGVVACVEDLDREAAALGGRANVGRLQSVELLLPGEEGGHEPSVRRSGLLPQRDSVSRSSGG